MRIPLYIRSTSGKWRLIWVHSHWYIFFVKECIFPIAMKKSVSVHTGFDHTPHIDLVHLIGWFDWLENYTTNVKRIKTPHFIQILFLLVVFWATLYINIIVKYLTHSHVIYYCNIYVWTEEQNLKYVVGEKRLMGSANISDHSHMVK